MHVSHSEPGDVQVLQEGHRQRALPAPACWETEDEKAPVPAPANILQELSQVTLEPAGTGRAGTLHWSPPPRAGQGLCEVVRADQPRSFTTNPLWRLGSWQGPPKIYPWTGAMAPPEATLRASINSPMRL